MMILLRTLKTTALFLVMTLSMIAQQTVEQWHQFDLLFDSPIEYSNPFMEVGITATFEGPGGEVLTIPGFYKGGNNWVVRFAPTQIGEWSYTTVSEDPQLGGQTGKLLCVKNNHQNVHGRLMIDEQNKRHFKYEDGSRFFLMGAEINWLALIDMQDPDLVKTRQIIDMYADRGFNTVLINAYTNDTTWRRGKTEDEDWGPPPLHAWPGSPDNYDFSKLNPEYWEHFDKVMDTLFEKGMVAYIYFKVYNKLVDWPEKGSKYDELYFSYIVARYQAYPGIIWSFSKESYYEPDHDYILKMLDLIASQDAYDRLITTHDDNGRGKDFAFDGEYGQILNFYTDQTQRDVHNNTFEDYLRKEWPISNMEPGYQRGNDGTNTYGGDNISPERLVKRIYEVIMAGGYATYYYTWHAWDVVRTAEEPENLVYYQYLTEFFGKTQWYAMAPADELIRGSENHCLANAGSEYIIYLGNGGSAPLTLEGVSGHLQGTWMNAYTGETREYVGISNGTNLLNSPWSDTPSLLWIRK